MLVLDNCLMSDGSAVRDSVSLRCPVCAAYPVDFLCRGQVARFFNPLTWLWRALREKPYPTHCVICRDCKEIIGYEEADANNYIFEQRRWLPASSPSVGEER
jgi:uncharacterized CHY-type Zn-finger protein